MELFGLEVWRHGRIMVPMEFCSEKRPETGTNVSI
jgi:hypothetical protein